ncbi:MAG TPA: MFS transporter [Steroidobacteraceae bacterium]|nr:MFS transporter [Steroidobacteraceae bacterium]
MITARLSVMMFLQFFIWGCWFVTLGTFLGANFQASGAQTGLAFSTQSWGAILAPFVIGLIADRFFNAERILAVLHLIGAALMYQMFRAQDFAQFYPCVLAYMIAYMPTLALVNSISFRQLTDPSRQFSFVRVWGTIGWIVAGLVISFVFHWDAQAAVANGALRNTFAMGAVMSLLLALFSLTLPATPPTASATGGFSLRAALGLDALALLRDSNFRKFFAASVLICIPLAFYYQNASPFLTEIGTTNATGKLTIGQMSEVGFMLLLPVFLLRFGIKKTLLLGMLAWAVRYVLFAYGGEGDVTALLIIGIALHGICYDFFFVSGQIYTDSKAGEHYRSAAQGLITLATYGVGMLIGFSIAGAVSDRFVTDGRHDWFHIWIYPAVFAAVIMALFATLFREEKISYAARAKS